MPFSAKLEQMINPYDVTHFDRTDRELQAFWLFCIMVAGKSSVQTATKLRRMIDNMPMEMNPLDFFVNNDIHNFLVAHKVGQYGRITRAIKESISINLRTATLEQLMTIHGIGPKTARFFILHSRKGANVAVLDTHILKWMKEYGVANVPDSTPDEKRYVELEQRFLDICRNMFPGVPIAEVDLAIWTKASRNE